MKWYVVFYKGVFDPMYHKRVVYTGDINRYIEQFNSDFFFENTQDGLHVFDHSETCAEMAQTLINRDGVKISITPY